MVHNTSVIAGQHADEGADDAAGEDVGPDLFDGLAVGQDAGDLFGGLAVRALAPGDDALNTGDDFRYGEEADQYRDKAQAALETCDAEGETLLCVGRVHADGAQQHPEEGAHQSL